MASSPALRLGGASERLSSLCFENSARGLTTHDPDANACVLLTITLHGSMRIIEEREREAGDARRSLVVSSSSLPRNLIVDSSYQGHRSSSLPPPPGPRRGGSGQRSLPLFADVWLRGRYREERRESVLSCFAHSDDNAGDTEKGEAARRRVRSALKGITTIYIATL